MNEVDDDVYIRLAHSENSEWLLTAIYPMTTSTEAATRAIRSTCLTQLSITRVIGSPSRMAMDLAKVMFFAHLL